MLLSVLALGCGGSSPAPAPIAKPVSPPSPAPAPVTCDDAAVILTPDGGDAEVRTEALTDACKDGGWSREILTCIGSSHQPSECVEGLPDYADLAQLMNVGNDVEEVDDAATAAAPLECEQVISTVWWYPPQLDDHAPERRWDLDVRRRTIVEACEHAAWSEEVKRCFQTATDENRPGPTCLDKLDQRERDELAKKVADIDTLAAAIENVKKKPGAISCKKVVAAHYADAKWRSKLDGFKPAERKKMIAESRAKMTKACTDTVWSDTLRGCVVAGGGETCFQTAGMGLAWGYPAAGVAVALGIPACDEYALQIAKVVACDKLPQTSRDALKTSADELFAQVLARPKAERDGFAASCKAGTEAIVQALASLGC
jgi:hypothetical protein